MVYHGGSAEAFHVPSPGTALTTLRAGRVGFLKRGGEKGGGAMSFRAPDGVG